MTDIMYEDGGSFRSEGSYLGAIKTLVEHLSKGTESEALEYTAGDILGRYELGNPITNPDDEGGQGQVFAVCDKETGNENLVAKVYYNIRKVTSWDEIEKSKKGAGRELSFLRRANIDGLPGVPTIVKYGITGVHTKSPVIIFDRVHGRTLREVLLDENYKPSDVRATNLLARGSGVLEYAHDPTKAGEMTVHRDIKPDNVWVNGDDWLNAILGDWAAATQTSGKTDLRTQIVSQYYSAPEVVNLKPFDGRADEYSFAKVMQHVLTGDIFPLRSGEPVRADFETMGAPGGAYAVLKKATEEEPGNRYKEIREFSTALNKVLRGKDLPARIETRKPVETQPEPIQSQTVNVNSDSGYLPVVDNGDGTVTIGKLKIDTNGKSPYEVIKSIGNCFEMPRSRKWAIDEYDFERASTHIFSYLNHAAPDHPILREVLSGEKTLEEIAGEKGPSLIGKIRRGLSHRKDFNKTTEDYLKITLHESVNSAIDNYKIEKEAHKERREQLYNIFGENKKTLLPFRERLRLDMQSSALEALANNVLILVFAPIYPALQMHAAIVKQKIKKKSRKLDSYIAGSRTIGEWRESQKPKGDLEGKVGLTGGEKERIENIITKMGDKIIYGSAILGASLGAIQGEHIEDKIMGFSTFGLLGWLGGLWMERKILNPLEKYLTNKKLREKRLAAGLDEDVREQTKSIRVNERKLLSIEDKGIDFLGDDLGKEVDKEIQKKYGAFAGISAIGYKRWSKIVKGSTPFYVVAVNEFFRDNGINLKSASQADLERALKSGALNLRGTYEDTALVLRDEDNPNQYLAKNLMEQVKARDKKQEMPVMIPLNGLELKIDSNAPHGLAFKLTDASEIIYAPILNKSGNFNSEDINEKTGLPNKTGKGNRTLYTRNSGLSRLYLVNVLYVLAGNVDLAYSNDYGRVVVVSAEGASLKTRKPIEVDLLPDNMKDMNSADWDEVERITGEKVKRRIR